MQEKQNNGFDYITAYVVKKKYEQRHAPEDLICGFVFFYVYTCVSVRRFVQVSTLPAGTKRYQLPEGGAANGCQPANMGAGY